MSYLSVLMPSTLSWGTLHQLVGPWKLLDVSFFLSSCIALVHAKEIYNTCSCKLSSFSLLPCKLSSYKLYSPRILCSCKLYLCLIHYVLANCIHAFLFFSTLGRSIWYYCSRVGLESWEFPCSEGPP